MREDQAMKKHLFIFGVLLGIVGIATADPSTLFRKAAEAYDAGKYAEAISLYNTMQSNGVANVELEYNLANAYFKSGNLPLAVLHYRRAWYKAPRDPDVAANLKFALGAAGAKEPAYGFIKEVLHSLSAHEWIVLGSIFYLLFVLLLLLAILRPNWRFFLFRAALVPLAICLLSGAGWWSWRQMEHAPEWVVTKAGATTFYSPVQGSTAHYKVPKAALVRQRALQPGWVKIEYDKQSGWLERAYLEPVSP
jgi:tetratricopeptide (TPR) repeat protein